MQALRPSGLGPLTATGVGRILGGNVTPGTLSSLPWGLSWVPGMKGAPAAEAESSSLLTEFKSTLCALRLLSPGALWAVTCPRGAMGSQGHPSCLCFKGRGLPSYLWLGSLGRAVSQFPHQLCWDIPSQTDGETCIIWAIKPVFECSPRSAVTVIIKGAAPRKALIPAAQSSQ